MSSGSVAVGGSVFLHADTHLSENSFHEELLPFTSTNTWIANPVSNSKPVFVSRFTHYDKCYSKYYKVKDVPKRNMQVLFWSIF